MAAAAAHDLNDELMIIVNASDCSLQTLEPGHPARPLLLDLQRAAQRCVWKTSGLLHFSARHGVRAAAAPMERLMLECEEPAFR